MWPKIWGYNASSRLPPLKILSKKVAPVAEALNHGVTAAEMKQLFRDYAQIIIVEFEPHRSQQEPQIGLLQLINIQM
jgi:hypothetical protein